MAGLDSSEFKIAWARIVAQAAVDEAFRTSLAQDPVPVFAEHGYSATDAKTKKALTDYVQAHLEPALDAVSHETAQHDGAAAASSELGGTQVGASRMNMCACGGDPCMATQPCGCTQCLPCWSQPQVLSGQGQPSGCGASPQTMARNFNSWGSAATFGSAGSWCGTAGSVGTAGSFGSAGLTSTQLAGPTAMGGTFGGAARTANAEAMNCWGSAGTFGSAGTWCGTAGSVGTGGTFGCGGGADETLAAAAGTTAMSGSFGNDPQALRFNCVGSVGTVGSVGSWCGTAGSAATAGTFGSAGMQSTQLSGATAGTVSGMARESAREFNCVGSFGTVGSVGSWCGTAGSAATAGTFGSAVTAENQMLAGGTSGASSGTVSGATLASGATFCGTVGSAGGGWPHGTGGTCWAGAGPRSF